MKFQQELDARKTIDNIRKVTEATANQMSGLKAAVSALQEQMRDVAKLVNELEVRAQGRFRRAP